MKKFTATAFCLSLIYAVSSCLEPSVNQPSPSVTQSGAREGTPVRLCAADDVLKQQLKDDPTLAKKLDDIEKQTKKFGLSKANGEVSANALVNGTVTIPVAVHVIYNASQENISQAQIQSQIDVLNQDYNRANSDVSKVPNAFSSRVATMNIQFTLASVDRKYSSKTSWGTRDAMKSSKTGGVDAVSPTTTLNIWVCNIGGGILGYAQFPGGKASTDGVVIGPNYFGNTGYVSAPFDKGRTATHEVGHWLNLRHIWGDANCGDDLVADTPTQQTSNYGCPAFPHVTCSNGPSGDMFMNYMDYTDDACMFMFSEGQKTRSQAIFAVGGPRNSFAR